MHWLPEPPDGTAICLGFDGSDVSDWTCLTAETVDGLAFTPRFHGKPTLWNPAEHGGRVPRAEVAAAVADLFGRFDVANPVLQVRDVGNVLTGEGKLRQGVRGRLGCLLNRDATSSC